MKAMILAAGLGTRLLPFSAHTPKPLFTISGQPILDRTIQKLQNAGVAAIIVNTHHLHNKIEDFITDSQYPIPVLHQYEPEILGTGGAIKNVETFWDDDPFLVVNSDIFFDFDLKDIYRYHLARPHPVTLVLFNDPEFNQVWVDNEKNILNFGGAKPALDPSCRALAFTGIQVVNPGVLKRIPTGRFASIIDVYREMLSTGETIQAYIPEAGSWKDLGTPQRYLDLTYEEMTREAFGIAFPNMSHRPPVKRQLKGDGSDRSWYRLTRDDQSLVMADHGIWEGGGIGEAAAFVRIGDHLKKKGVPVPEIVLSDTFSGLVFMEDLGDISLQQYVLSVKKPGIFLTLYQQIIKHLIHMSTAALQGFDPSWTVQSQAYDQKLILEKECHYFIDSFINLYLGLEIDVTDLENEFSFLAHETMELAVTGLMHRDMQSRNIMLKNGQPYFIDFQGARRGPLQYDLAALLMDPYVALPKETREVLLGYCLNRLSTGRELDKKRFVKGYEYCTITRNLQALGAFGHLSRNKGKTYFERYIPRALSTLNENLNIFFTRQQFPKLKGLVKNAIEVLPRIKN
jgi:aminoglycoside/choline kinase family phosphotransferase/dTDP-glucose pyrophosphorylase